MKNRLFIGISMIVLGLTGCSLNPNMMNNDYGTLKIDNSSQEELDELKAEYDTLIAERDELQLKVDEYEQTITDLEDQIKELSDEDNEDSTSENENDSDETADETDQSEEDTDDYYHVFEGIRYFSTPISVNYYYGTANIEYFELTAVEQTENDNIKISYSIKGEANDDGYFNAVCYDADGYQLGTFMIFIDIAPNGDYIKFKFDDNAYIPQDTAFIDLSNKVEDVEE